MVCVGGQARPKKDGAFVRACACCVRAGGEKKGACAVAGVGDYMMVLCRGERGKTGRWQHTQRKRGTHAHGQQQQQ